jgi:hypothetical protein
VFVACPLSKSGYFGGVVEREVFIVIILGTVVPWSLRGFGGGEAPPARTSTAVPTLWKEEDPVVAPTANLISVHPIDAALMGVALIILSSDNEDEVD